MRFCFTFCNVDSVAGFQIKFFLAGRIYYLNKNITKLNLLIHEIKKNSIIILTKLFNILNILNYYT